MVMCEQVCGGNCTSCREMGEEERAAVRKKIEKYVRRWKGVRGSLMAVLHDVQEDEGYIPRDMALELAKALEIPLARFYEVLTFYHYFKLVPQGKYNISVCLGTACYLKGSGLIADGIRKKLNVKDGETTADGLFHLDAARCVGACGLAPVFIVNEDVYGRINRAEEVDAILAKYN